MCEKGYHRFSLSSWYALLISEGQEQTMTPTPYFSLFPWDGCLQSQSAKQMLKYFCSGYYCSFEQAKANAHIYSPIYLL